MADETAIAAVALRLDEFSHTDKVIEIQAMQRINRIELMELFGCVITCIADTAANNGPILLFDKGIIVLRPPRPRVKVKASLAQ